MRKRLRTGSGKVLDLEGLLKTKQVPRPKDQADAEAIRRALDLLKRR